MEVLVDQLGDADPEPRRRAVLDLAERPEARAALIRRLGVESDRTVREAICNQLARYDEPAVVDGLIGYLASEDAGLRNAVVEVLSRTTTHTARRVPQLLADPDPDVRILSVTVVSALRLPEVEGWLTEVVRRDPHLNVVSAAIGELAPIAGSRCVPALQDARDRFPQDPFIAFALARALAASDQERR